MKVIAPSLKLATVTQQAPPAATLDQCLINLRLPNLMEAIENSPTVSEAENLHEVVIHIIDKAGFTTYVKNEWMSIASDRLMRVKRRTKKIIEFVLSAEHHFGGRHSATFNRGKDTERNPGISSTIDESL